MDRKGGGTKIFGEVKTRTAATEEDTGDPALRLYIEAKLEEICAERQLTTYSDIIEQSNVHLLRVGTFTFPQVGIRFRRFL